MVQFIFCFLALENSVQLRCLHILLDRQTPLILMRLNPDPVLQRQRMFYLLVLVSLNLEVQCGLEAFEAFERCCWRAILRWWMRVFGVGSNRNQRLRALATTHGNKTQRAVN